MRLSNFLVLLFVLIFVLCVPLVSADFEVVKEDWFELNDVNTFSGSNVTFRLNPNNYDSMFVSVDGVTVSVNKGYCKSSFPFEFCYESFSTSEPEAYLDSSGTLWPAVFVVVSRDESADNVVDLVVSYGGNTSVSLLSNELAIFEIENEGAVDASSATLRVSFSPNVSISDKGDFNFVGKDLTKTFSLDSGEVSDFSFRYLALGEGRQVLQYNLSFFNSQKNVVLSKTSSISVSEGFDFSASVDKKEYKVGDKVVFVLEIVNEDEDFPLTFDSITFRYPSNIFANVPVNGVFDSSGKFSSSLKSVSGDSSVKTGFSLNPQVVSSFNISGSAFFSFKGSSLSKEFNLPVSVVAQGIRPVFDFRDDVVNSSLNQSFDFLIVNDDKSLEFSDFQGSVFSDFFYHDFKVGSIRPLQSSRVYSDNFKVPIFAKDTNLFVVANFSYVSPTGELLFSSSNDSFKVKGVGEDYTVSRKVSRSSAKRNDSITVTVTLKSLVDRDLDLVATEILPFVSDGLVHEFVLPANEQIVAYDFSFEVPALYPDTFINSLSSVSKKGIPSYVVERSNRITVQGDIPNDALVVSSQKSSSVSTSADSSSSQAVITPVVKSESDVIVDEVVEREPDFWDKLLAFLDSIFS